MTPGIHRLFDSSEKNDWRLAMVFGFMQMGDDEMALRAIKISDPDQIWFEQAAKCLAEHLELNQGEVFNRIQMVANN
jgi:L-rhamnose mutarotase